MDASGNISAVNTFGATGLLSRRVTSTNASVFYTFDERGNVAQRTDAGANVLSSDLYDGYGKKMAGPSDVWGFGAQAGYYTDGETGLVLCTHRFYDPQTGRFLTRDPISYNGGINLYGYTANNPVNESDASGLDVYILSWPGGIGGSGSHAGIGVDWPGAPPKVFDFGPGGPDKGTLFYLNGGTSPGEVIPGTLNLINPIIPSHPKEPPNYEIEVPTTAAQDKSIRNWLMNTIADDSNNWGGSYGRYDGGGHQCSSYVNDALKAGGIDTGLGRDHEPGFLKMIRGLEGLSGFYGGAIENENATIVKPSELRQWGLGQPGAIVIYRSGN